MLPSQFKRLIATLHSQLSAIEAILQEQIDAIRNAHIRTDEQRLDPPRIIATAISSLDIPKEEERKATATSEQNRHTQNLKQQKWLTFWTALAFGAATVYAAIAAKELTKMDQTYKEMKTQTDLMRQQTEALFSTVMYKQFGIAWSNPSQAYLWLGIMNRGKTKATGVRADIQITEYSIRDHQTRLVRKLPPWTFKIDEVFTEPDTGRRMGINMDVSRDDMIGNARSFNILKLTGTVSYFNGFRDKVDQVCSYMLSSIQFRDKNGKVTTTYGNQAINCDELPTQIAFFREQQKVAESGP